MIAAFESLLPIFLIIALGFLLRWRAVMPDEMWRGVEFLGYWVLFPALLTETLIRADLQSLQLGGIAFTMVASFLTLSAGILAAQRWIMERLGLDGASFSSVFQSATRWNAFIALPILAKLQGDAGVTMVAVAMAALIPLANLANVVVLARNAGERSLSVGQTFGVVFRNPFIWSTAVGLLINFSGFPIYEPLMTGLHILGGAAIGTGLLMVGAGLEAGEAVRPSPAVWLGTVLKLGATPLLVALFGIALGLSDRALLACLVCASVPTAMSAYVLARQMGGDAPLVAATVTVQTLVSFLSIPLVIYLAERLT